MFIIVQSIMRCKNIIVRSLSGVEMTGLNNIVGRRGDYFILVFGIITININKYDR